MKKYLLEILNEEKGNQIMPALVEGEPAPATSGLEEFEKHIKVMLPNIPMIDYVPIDTSLTAENVRKMHGYGEEFDVYYDEFLRRLEQSL